MVVLFLCMVNEHIPTPQRFVKFSPFAVKMENDANCDATQIRVTVPGYTEQVGFELEQIQVHAQFILIDNVTGFRSQSHQ